MTEPTLLHLVNGVYASGEPALPAELTLDDLAAVGRRRPQEAAHLELLRHWLDARGGEPVRDERGDRDERKLSDTYVRHHVGAGREDWGLPHDIDARNLQQTGWAVVFPRALPQARRARLEELLRPLLERRRQEAGRLYRELEFRATDSKAGFLARYGVGDGPAVPDRVPYYLLLLGDPGQIPLSFQFELGVQYAAGRLHLRSDEAYAAYARAAAQDPPTNQSRVSLFGTDNGDMATALAEQHLTGPLHQALARTHTAKGWSVGEVSGEQATRLALEQLLGERPGLLFTASHGLLEKPGAPEQRARQGALVCSDWRGHGAIDPQMTFAGDDLDERLDLRGLIAFHFACFSAGTPQLDGFTQALLSGPRSGLRPSPIAPEDFLAWLPTRMLGNPGGASLAAIGHVDRAWSSSFLSRSWDPTGPRRVTSISAFENTLRALLDGIPVGAALEHLRGRYGEKATELVGQLAKVQLRAPTERETEELAYSWTCTQDARSYLLLGDPAVRLRTPAEPVPVSTTNASPAPTVIPSVDDGTGQDARAVVAELTERLERWTTEDPLALTLEARREVLDQLAALLDELRASLLPNGD